MSFGMAAAMALTPPRLVSSGYYRNNLYVLLGCNVLVTLVAWTSAADAGLYLWPPLVASLLCYAGAVAWLYERPKAGTVLLLLLAGVTLTGCWLDTPSGTSETMGRRWLGWLDPVGGGLVLGMTMAAMLLGHWYLNSPGMKLEPLGRLILLMAAAVALRAVLSAAGAGLEVASQGVPGLRWWCFLALRWLSGVVGALVVAAMAWQTLKIPNTQSATGILYVGVMTTFLGELTAQLLSRDAAFPL
jgi:hypothetical protein